MSLVLLSFVGFLFRRRVVNYLAIQLKNEKILKDAVRFFERH